MIIVSSWCGIRHRSTQTQCDSEVRWGRLSRAACRDKIARQDCSLVKWMRRASTTTLLVSGIGIFGIFIFWNSCCRHRRATTAWRNGEHRSVTVRTRRRLQQQWLQREYPWLFNKVNFRIRRDFEIFNYLYFCIFCLEFFVYLFVTLSCIYIIMGVFNV